MRIKKTLALVTATFVTIASGCGKTEDDEDADEASDPNTVAGTGGAPAAPAAPTLATSHEAVGYALSALTSATIGASASLNLDKSRSSAYPKCSDNGAPWDDATGQPMQVAHERFAERTFTCQLTSDESPALAHLVDGAAGEDVNVVVEVTR